MQTATRLFGAVGRVIGIGVVAFVILHSGPALAQGPATAPRAAAQLEQLVAPIALYPDSLLSQVLMASTYPLEVVAAARWSQANPSVTGDALQNAMAQQTWDPSVKALTAVPQTLQMMNDKLDWTQQLGDAFLAQQSDVLDAVQRLRARADANGQLKSTPEQKVTTTPRPAGQQPSATAPATVYAIEPTNPDEYYVPIYDPGVVYGAWPYSDYEPFYWYPPGYAYGNAFSFAAGAFVGSAIWGNVNWGLDRVQINPLRYNNFNRTNIADANWNHNPAHRGGVPYRDTGVAQRFGNQAQSAAREGFRNTANTGRQQLGQQGQAGAANKAKQAAGARTGAGGKQAANTKAPNTKAANTKAANSKNAAGAKKAAGTKQAGAKQAAGKKQAGSKQAGGNKQAGSKQAAGNKQAGAKQARANQGAQAKQGAGNRQGARNTGPRQTAAPGNVGGRSRAQSAGGGGMRAGGGAGGGRGGGGRGGGRRSDIRLKHDLILLGHLDNGLGFYRFAYNGSDKAYVGVIAQEVQTVMPQAVTRDRDGYLRVYYDKLGVTFQTYDHWIAAGARIPDGFATQQ
jgi:hypothetical protein